MANPLVGVKVVQTAQGAGVEGVGPQSNVIQQVRNSVR
jgi:hypothetical protein